MTTLASGLGSHLRCFRHSYVNTGAIVFNQLLTPADFSVQILTVTSQHHSLNCMFGMCNVLSLRSQVTPAANQDPSSLTELTVGNSSRFNQLVQSGDVRAATQLANAVLQTADQLNSTTSQDKIAVCDDIATKHFRYNAGHLVIRQNPIITGNLPNTNRPLR